MKISPTVAVSLLVVVLSAAQLSSALFINPLDIFRRICGNPTCPSGYELNSDQCQCEAVGRLGVSIPGCRNNCVLDRNDDNCRCLITGRCYEESSCDGRFVFGYRSATECCSNGYSSYDDGRLCATCVQG